MAAWSAIFLPFPRRLNPTSSICIGFMITSGGVVRRALGFARWNIWPRSWPVVGGKLPVPESPAPTFHSAAWLSPNLPRQRNERAERCR